MAKELIMPKLGMSMKEGTLVEWLKDKGDPVKKGEAIAVISSDKIEKDIEAPEDGVLLEITANPNDVIEVGRPIAYIGEEGDVVPKQTQTVVNRLEFLKEEEPPVAGSNTAKTMQAKMPKSSPAARKLAKESGIDLTLITGTGPNGRITREDVEKAKGANTQSAPPREGERRDEQGIKEFTVTPVSGMRKAISEKMHQSLQQTAQLTLHAKADITELLRIQKQAKTGIEDGIKLTLTDFIARAVVIALEKHPIINSTYVENEIRTYKPIHLGIAVALDNGLVVPVIRHADQISLRELSKQISGYANRARKGSLNGEEMSGSTFTITNLGSYKVEYFTPVLNTPETAILGVCRATPEPIYSGEELERRDMLPLSLTFDHRAYDGAPASAFLMTVVDYLENPYRMLI